MTIPIPHALAAAALALPAIWQEPAKPDTEKKPTLGELGVAPDDPRQEMVGLFHKVETRLQEIDRLLYDAAAGETRLTELEESGIAELLRRSHGRGKEVVEGIDKILEIARQNGGT